MKKTGIYKITSPTNKIYIGQSLDIDKRWYHYKNLRCKGQPQLYNSLIHHGINNHTFEILEECNPDALDGRETHHKQHHIDNHGWDSAMFTMLNDGKGGNKSSTTKQKMSIASTRTTRAVNVYKLDGTFIAQFDSPSQAKNILFPDIKDTTGGIIQSCNQSKQKTFRGCIFQWADSDNIEHVLAGLQNNVKIKQQTVLQYDLEGNFIREYPNSYCVEKEYAQQGIRINSTDVRACCNGKQKTCGGYRWQYGTTLVENTIKEYNTTHIETQKHIYNQYKQDLTQHKPNILDLTQHISNLYSGSILYDYAGEIDIYLPDLGLGINVVDLKDSVSYEKNYTRDLYAKYSKLNVKLIQMFSDELLNKKDIVYSRIQNELKANTTTIFARKCEIREVAPNVKNQFLDQNHIQGRDQSFYKYGLYYQNELVSIMTFRKPRTAIGKTNVNNGDTWELIRFCNKKYTNVIGAASRLLKHFIREVQPYHVYSFADNRWSSPISNLYLTCGFKHVSTSQHGYWYTNDYMSREHRFNYNKGALKKMGLDTENHTEVELMRNMGYHRVWDCGVTRYEIFCSPIHCS